MWGGACLEGVCVGGVLALRVCVCGGGACPEGVCVCGGGCLP